MRPLKSPPSRDDEPSDTDAGLDPRSIHASRITAALLCVALAFLLASLMPPALAAASFKSLMFWSAAGAALIGALAREPVMVDRMTYWDQAALMLGLSVLASLFIDVEALRAALEQIQAAQGTEGFPSIGSGH